MASAVAFKSSAVNDGTTVNALKAAESFSVSSALSNSHSFLFSPGFISGKNSSLLSINILAKYPAKVFDIL